VLNAKIHVINKNGFEVANLRTNKTSGRLGTYYLVYNKNTGFTPGTKPANSPRMRRAASLAAAIIEGIPKQFDRKRGPSEGWESAGTLMWLGQSTGVPLYKKKAGGAQKYVRVKGTDKHIYSYKGWKIIGDDLVWVGDKLSVKSDSIARAIAEAAIRTPAVFAHVKPGEHAGLLARLFSRNASPSAVRSVQRNARVANAIRNALSSKPPPGSKPPAATGP